MKSIVLNRKEFNGLVAGKQTYICRPVPVTTGYKLSGQTKRHYLFGFKSRAIKTVKKFREQDVFGVKEPTAYRIRKEPGLTTQVDIVYQYDYSPYTKCEYNWIPAERIRKEYIRTYLIVLSCKITRIHELTSGEVYLLGFMNVEDFISDWDETYPDFKVRKRPWVFLVKAKAIKGKYKSHVKV
jgi:hypothetical protein